MKTRIAFSTAALTFLCTLAVAKTAAPKRAVANAGQTISCGDLKFTVPAKMGDLPDLDFSYPVKVVEFSFRDGNLLLVAMDKDDSSRPRVMISAQLNAKTKAYTGQIVHDDGGNELQFDNGPVTCTVK